MEQMTNHWEELANGTTDQWNKWPMEQLANGTTGQWNNWRMEQLAIGHRPTATPSYVLHGETCQ